MQKLENLREVIDYLNEKEILTTDGRNQIFLEDKKVKIFFNGSSVSLSMKDFIDLYGKSTFYFQEEESGIDDSKDEDYYRYYRK